MNPQMHCHDELLKDLEQRKEFLTDELLIKWFRDQYSTSKHLLTLYSAVIAQKAKVVVEVGFGRSTFVLAKAVAETGGKLYCCDVDDYQYLLSDAEKSVIQYVNQTSDALWEQVSPVGVDVAFLDYFSGEDIPKKFVRKEVKKCYDVLRKNGLIFIHDVFDERYRAGDWFQGLKGSSRYEEVIMPYNYGLGLIRKTHKSNHGELVDRQKKKPETRL